ncbi:MAG: alanine racemase [Rhodocyclaceae bacterium]|nr:alanine racemase [Rhodocyclaceae bacterium]
MPRPISATIDLSALRHNYLLAKSRAPGARALAVVKANAYGHGLMRAVAALAGTADGYALLEIEDAVRLREAGLREPILLLEGAFDRDDLGTALHYSLDLVVHETRQIDLLAAAADRARQCHVWLKINTGMNRLGFAPAAAGAALARTQALGCEVSLMTHFADADGAGGVSAQLATLAAALPNWRGPVSAANSAALLRFPAAHGQVVRPGIMLYGASPFPDLQTAAELGLRPVMTLKSRIIALQQLASGDRVGYGGQYQAAAPGVLGVVACGYADGYPRHAPSGTPVSVDGHRTRLVGRVSMDMVTVDLTDLPHVAPGAEVVLWGAGNPADEVATAAGTVAYELFCALAARVPVSECGLP